MNFLWRRSSAFLAVSITSGAELRHLVISQHDQLSDISEQT
jgi:hypothetical protein